MPTALTNLIDDLEKHPQLLTLVACLGLLLAAWVLNWIVKRILVRGFYRLLRSTSFGQDQELNHHRVIGRLANIVPALVLSIGIELVPGRPEALVTVVQNVCSAFIVLTIALALGSALNVVNVLYSRRPSARLKPIKGYVQVSKIVIYAIAVILMIATLIDRSPLILLSGLGAMAAVLLLIFQDTLLSLVASVQISSNDIIRVGDWIEMPQLNADGDVIDIALHTVKVQNFDKTITTIPTKRFITDSFRNYRGMQEAGGRRIKRALNIDQNSVHFLSDAEREHLHRFNLLDDYLTAKEQELADWNRKLEKRGQEPVNTRRVTNLGTFRAYVERYLRAHPGVHQGMTLLVRQMPLSSEGLPVEIYCFTNTTVWAQYEGIQGDIFDHLLSILPEFGLHVFQHPSGRDFRMRLEPTEAMTSLGEPGTPAP
ncbi:MULTISPECIES: mechanosensitive ion channel family protein [Pseudomonadaceae]|jgi:miniconductance mechanosensitive channel|uniref:Mechanosensitive ion channel protein MscS n=2 Tax=Pseudomonadaceae TaxID=135621 RepID=A0A1G5PHC2_9PSED|nr:MULTISPECIES: mechanosensitive ion channel family protein [Pseudomonas]KIZ50900.1 mechanosensitive ion channel protein MscS [Pseudomonas oryzihabitans]MBA1259666.1 mechanosensitive ion channel family protein [Pseudomonas psychrotolerans]MDK4200616.1 mechanosensitive ion channel family protein [Pseudomonas sp. HR1]MDU4057662.1 mechanosensitive ion channel family protein [Pseudomonas oryzihabitans]NMY93225.1 mechanosensitive ion channel family protein [Pseudomonas psychrotolerans]